MVKDFRRELEGYEEISREIQVLRKYGQEHQKNLKLWQKAVERLHPLRLNLKVKEVLEENTMFRTLRLVSKDGYLPPFQAGQYIKVEVEVEGKKLGRPYSISSPPYLRAYYDITVKRVENGVVSTYLFEKVGVGTSLSATGPAGNFVYNPVIHGKELVFLAGGIGVTPFMSMIREFTGRGTDLRMHLIYGCTTVQDACFKSELEELSQKNENFRYTLVLMNPPEDYRGETGIIDRGLVTRVVTDWQNKTFFLSGPREMLLFVERELEALGVPKARIRREVLGPPRDVTTETGWPSTLAKDKEFQVKLSNGSIIKAKAGETLLASLEKSGVAVKSSCRAGECSLCRTKLLEGKVFEPSGVKVRSSDRALGYIHPCMAYPISDLVLEIPSL